MVELLPDVRVDSYPLEATRDALEGYEILGIEEGGDSEKDLITQTSDMFGMVVVTRALCQWAVDIVGDMFGDVAAAFGGVKHSGKRE